MSRRIKYYLSIFLCCLFIFLSLDITVKADDNNLSQENLKKIALDLTVDFGKLDIDSLENNVHIDSKLRPALMPPTINAARKYIKGTYVSSSVLDITHENIYCVRTQMTTTLGQAVLKIYIDNNGIIRSFWIESSKSFKNSRDYYSFIIAIMLFSVLYCLLPYLTRKTLVFGIRIPSEKCTCDEIKKIKKTNIIFIYLLVLPLNLIVNYILFKKDMYPSFNISIIIILVEFVVLFILFHYKTKHLKKSQGWSTLMSKSAIIDTKYTYSRRKKVVLSPFWYAIPYGVIISSFILIKNNTERIGDIIPVRWTYFGEPLAWVDKTHFHILILHGSLFIFCSLFLLCNFIVSYAKQSIDSNEPDLSIKRDAVSRKRISILLFAIANSLTVTPIIFFLNNVKFINIPNTLLKIISITCYIVIPGIFIVMLLLQGQGGSRLFLSKNKQSTDCDKFKTVDDDRFWKLGFIYFNRNDPSVFVEKRHGIGYSINFGNLYSILFLFLIIAVVFYNRIF